MTVPTAARLQGRNRSILLYIILSLFAYFSSVLPVPLVLGMELVFSSFFLLVSLHYFGWRWSTVQVLLVHGAVLLFQHEPLFTMVSFTLEIWAAALVMYGWKRRGRLLTTTLVYWLLVGIPLHLLFYYVNYDSLDPEIVLYVVTVMVNHLFNALLASIIAYYAPLLLSPPSAPYERIPLSQVLQHITIFGVVGSSFLFMVNTGQSVRGELQRGTAEQARELSHSLSQSYASWTTDQVRAVRLHSLLQIGAFRSMVGSTTLLAADQAVLYDHRGEIIMKYTARGGAEQLAWLQQSQWKSIGERLYEWKEQGHPWDVPGSQWQRMAVIAEVPLKPFKLYLKMSTAEQSDRILQYYLSQSMNVLFTTLVMGIFALFIQRFVLRSIIGLAAFTEAVPEKLREGIPMTWAKSSRIIEIHTLGQNFRQLTEQLGKMLSESRAQAYFDMLTGLPNRRNFTEHLSDLLYPPEIGEMPPTAVMFIDLDRFKQINDTLGHGIGDGLLRQVAARLTEVTGTRSFVARLGGDEFVIIMPDAQESEVEGLATSLLHNLARMFEVQGHELFVAGSIGIAMAPKDGEDLDTVVKNADSAMYLAKEEGGNAYRFYSSRESGNLSRSMTIEFELRRALQREELRLHYQPVINAVTGEIIGAEALLRWHHPTLGNIPPLQFIPIAESTGIIAPLGEWVIRTACAQGAAWQQEAWGKISIGINLSTTQLSHYNVVDYIERVLEESELEPSMLNLEITEDVFAKKPEKIIAELSRLQHRGTRIWMDDFGTGYSSLAMLKRLPVGGFKIDRSFIREMLEDPDQKAIVQTIMSLANIRGWRVVAEGIEVAEQRDMLLEMNCTIHQGYHYGRPMPPEELEALLILQEQSKGEGRGGR